jgi:hypothetical protein
MATLMALGSQPHCSLTVRSAAHPLYSPSTIAANIAPFTTPNSPPTLLIQQLQTLSTLTSPECGYGPLPPWKPGSNRCENLIYEKIARHQEFTPPTHPAYANAKPTVSSNFNPNAMFESPRANVSRILIYGGGMSTTVLQF